MSSMMPPIGKVTQYLRPQEVRVCARAGATLDNCIAEAIALSMRAEVDVVLQHNGREYHIDFDDLVEVTRERSRNIDPTK